MTRALVIARRLYAAALALWPRSLRERYGHDMRATFDALLRMKDPMELARLRGKQVEEL